MYSTKKVIRSIFVKIVESYPYETYGIFGVLQTLPRLGRTFLCPCCGWGFRKLFSFGVKPRKNARCPRCFSLERHRLIWLYLKRKTGLFKEKLRLLHVAPEYAFARHFKKLRTLDYTSIDLKSPLAQIKMDLTKLSFPNDYFDVILASHVLEHIPDDTSALRELFRVLKPGGWTILQSALNPRLEKTLEAPEEMSPLERARKFGGKDHVRIYGQDYPERLEKAGFSVDAIPYAEELGNEEIKKYALHKEEKIYLCHKIA